MQSNSRPRWTRPQLAALTAAALFGVLACVTTRREAAPSVHGWWAERGPVVPHATFPADCSLCHLAGADWATLRADFHFDHGLETGLALEGAHADAQCLRCHNDRGPVQLFSVRGCAGCHEDVHRGQLGKDCLVCHDERTWRPTGQIALHDRTRFPLVGAHATTACWRCHPGAEVGNFTRAQTDCVACHLADYQRTTTPNHGVVGFPTSCQSCHVPHAWQRARFDHRFPITSGDHAGFACQDCHLNPRNFQRFSCIHCHEHRRSEMNAEHEGVPGYVYESGACYLCHPDGKD
jgi:hypothetical protein